MYRALVATDADEDRAVAQAEAVRRLPGEGTDVEATVLHVTDGDLDGEHPALERAMEVLAEAGADVDREVRKGDPAPTILEVASETDAEAIVLGGRKRSPLGSVLFGSVSQAVLADASRPVIITGTDIKEDPTQVCESCGETYHVDPAVEIQSCRSCGGTKVAPVE